MPPGPARATRRRSAAGAVLTRAPAATASRSSQKPGYETSSSSPGRRSATVPATPASAATAKAIAMRWSPPVAIAASPRRCPARDPPAVGQLLDVAPIAAGRPTIERDPVRLLDPQLARIAQLAGAVGGGHGDGEQRQLVDERRRPRSPPSRIGRRRPPLRDRRSPDRLRRRRTPSRATSISAPISRSTSRSARRVGLRPTSRQPSSASGWSARGHQPCGGRRCRRAPSSDRARRAERGRRSWSQARRGGSARPSRPAAARCGRASARGRRSSSSVGARAPRSATAPSTWALATGRSWLHRAGGRRRSMLDGRRGRRSSRPGAHRAQRRGDALHRPPRQRFVADRATPRDCPTRQRAREQPHGGAGVAAVERLAAARQLPAPSSRRDPDAHRAHAAARRSAPSVRQAPSPSTRRPRPARAAAPSASPSAWR